MHYLVGTVRVTFVEVGPWKRLNHGHESAHACIVLRGAFVERDVQGDRWCSEGQARVSPAGDAHRLQFAATGARCLVVTAGHDLAELLPAIRERHFLRAGRVHAASCALIDAARKGLSLEAELATLELFATGTRVAGGRRPGWPERVRDALRDSVAVPPSLATLARLTGLHPVYVARGFRRRFGCSIGAYLRRVRAERARREILESTVPLAQVAAACGYADQPHMNRDLRRLLGCTPGALRQVRTIQEPRVLSA